MKISSKTLIQLVVVVIVVGALLHSKYPTAGLIIALCAIGVYLLRNLPTAIRDIRHFKQLNRNAKVRLYFDPRCSYRFNPQFPVVVNVGN